RLLRTHLGAPADRTLLADHRYAIQHENQKYCADRYDDRHLPKVDPRNSFRGFVGLPIRRSAHGLRCRHDLRKDVRFIGEAQRGDFLQCASAPAAESRPEWILPPALIAENSFYASDRGLRLGFDPHEWLLIRLLARLRIQQ